MDSYALTAYFLVHMIFNRRKQENGQLERISFSKL